VPLLINTMGWNQGLGLCLLKDILLQFKPSHVVQINHSVDANKNMPVLDRAWLNAQDAHSAENRFPRARPAQHAMETCEPPADQYADAVQYKLLTLKSYVSAKAASAPRLPESKRYSAKDHRTIATVAYFAPLQRPDAYFQSIHHLQPYRVPWAKFALHCAHVRVDFSQLFRVFNAALVGLCVVDEKHVSQTQLANFLI